MANSNFVVQNGLTVGPLTIDAATGSITTTGTIGGTVYAATETVVTLNSTTGNITNIGTSNIVATVGSVGTLVATNFSSGNVVITGNTASTSTIYAQGIYDNANRVLSTSTGAGNLAISGTAVTLPATGPGATTVGGSTAIPIITTDPYGRVVALSTASLSTSSISNGTSNVSVANNSGTTIGVAGANVAYVGSGGATINGSLVVSGNFTVNGTQTTINNTTVETTEYVNTINATNVYASTIGNTGATLTGTLSTAAQTNVTSLGTLTGLTVSGAIVPNANVTVNLGSTSAWFNNIYGTAIHAQYADLAENYVGDKNYNPGTVLMFGGSQEVTVADADTTAVAGVVSTNPATLMNGGLVGPNVVPVAFTGRVPCNVIGPIKKGDLMVSAGFGYAKVNNTPQVGSIIGKALQDFPVNGKGVIEVVVGRF
jgi:hypothetical protein